MQTDDKAVVKEYFNDVGFERWRKIYGNDQVNRVQQDIRLGHQQTVETVVNWLKDDGNLSEISICDAGCGTGSLAIPLAQQGATVYASDISDKMVEESQQQAQAALGDNHSIHFSVQDLEGITGGYHTVICLDVLIHYPDQDIPKMVQHLANCAESRLILSFAPKTFFLTLLKKIGEFFPGPSKTTRAYQHSEKEIIKLLQDNGMTIKRQDMTSRRFYFSRIIEAVHPE